MEKFHRWVVLSLLLGPFYDAQDDMVKFILIEFTEKALS